jgi:anti-sigma factor RsiW
MDCPVVRTVSDDFLAGELPAAIAREVQAHLVTCAECSADLAGRRAVRDSVRRAFQSAPGLAAAPAFVAGLRTTLEQSARQASTRRRQTFRGLLALAATLAVAAALSVVFLGSGRVLAMAALARAAVGDHKNCAVKFRLSEAPISLEQAAARFGSVYRVVETLPPDAIVTPAGDARVLERHACVYRGRRFAHIVLRYRGELVSLLVTATDGSSGSAVPLADLPAVTSVSRIDGTSVVGFQTAHHAVFLAGNITKADLTTLADAISAPLYAGLAGA